jgi:hypothetical protein
MPFNFFGIEAKINIIDCTIIIIVTFLIDLDHLPALKKLGFGKVIYVQKKIPSPLHTFFFMLLFLVASIISLAFNSKILALFLFLIVLHLLWDLFEDVVIFGISYKRWARIWAVDNEGIEKLSQEIQEGP